MNEISTPIDDSQSEEEIIYEEGYTSLEIINGVYFALSSVMEMDTTLMTKIDEQRINRVKKKSIKMLDWAIADMYDSIFDDEGNED
jgi:hypothetical protein